MELAVTRLGATSLLVSATNTSRGFWLRQGLHVTSLCPPAVAAALKLLAQRGARFGFFQTGGWGYFRTRCCFRRWEICQIIAFEACRLRSESETCRMQLCEPKACHSEACRF